MVLGGGVVLGTQLSSATGSQQLPLSGWLLRLLMLLQLSEASNPFAVS